MNKLQGYGIRLCIITLLILTARNVSSIPLPHGIEGKLYELDGVTEVRAGTDFSVTDMSTSETITGKTGRGGSGRYSVSLNGNDGDLIVIMAWNIANTANISLILGGVMSNVNLLLNMSLPNYPPKIISEPELSAIQDIEYVYDVEASDYNEEDILVYYLIHAPSGMEINTSTGRITWLPKNEQVGTQEVIIQVMDDEINDTQLFNITVANVNDPPLIITGPVTSATEDLEYIYDADAIDIDGDELIYSLAVYPDDMSINSSTGIIKWTPENKDVGSHNITIFVSDYDSIIPQSYLLTVININDAPLIISVPETTAIQDEQYSYDVEVSDEDNDFLIYSLSAYPDGMIINTTTGIIKWIPDNKQIGNNRVILRVSDGNLSANQSFIIYVLNVNDPPEIIMPPEINTTSRELFLYKVNATEPDNDSITFYLIKYPDKMEIGSENGIIRWLPKNKDSGNNKVILMASDGSLSANHTFNVFVSKSHIRENDLREEIVTDNTNQADTRSKNSASGSTLLNPEVISHTPIPVVIYPNNSPINAIILTPEINLNSNISIEKFNTKPPEIRDSVPRKVYLYIKINDLDDNDGIIESAKIIFRVEKEWINRYNLSSDDIILNRYVSGRWKELNTTLTKEDTQYYNYEAVTEGFSYFAISLKYILDFKEQSTSRILNPFKIIGNLYSSKKTQTQAETPFIIENLNTHEIIRGSTGIATFTGKFAAVVHGNYGDNVTIKIGNDKAPALSMALKSDISEINLLYNPKKSKYIPVTGFVVSPIHTGIVNYKALLLSAGILLIFTHTLRIMKTKKSDDEQ